MPIRACGSIGSYRPLVGSHGLDTAFNNHAGPYVSHTDTVRGFETHTGPKLAVMISYGQFPHGYTT